MYRKVEFLNWELVGFPLTEETPTISRGFHLTQISICEDDFSVSDFDDSGSIVRNALGVSREFAKAKGDIQIGNLHKGLTNLLTGWVW